MMGMYELLQKEGPHLIKTRPADGGGWLATCSCGWVHRRIHGDRPMAQVAAMIHIPRNRT